MVPLFGATGSPASATPAAKRPQVDMSSVRMKSARAPIEVIPHPVCFEAFAFASEFAEPIRVGIAGPMIAGIGVDRPAPVSPYAQRSGLTMSGQVSCLGIDLDHAPRATLTSGALR